MKIFESQNIYRERKRKEMKVLVGLLMLKFSAYWKQC